MVVGNLPFLPVSVVTPVSTSEQIQPVKCFSTLSASYFRDIPGAMNISDDIIAGGGGEEAPLGWGVEN